MVCSRSYFAPEGLEYGVCRIPMAGTDCSTRPYSYDDVEGDVDLVYFNLTQEDYVYKVSLAYNRCTQQDVQGSSHGPALKLDGIVSQRNLQPPGVSPGVSYVCVKLSAKINLSNLILVT